MRRHRLSQRLSSDIYNQDYRMTESFILGSLAHPNVLFGKIFTIIRVKLQGNHCK